MIFMNLNNQDPNNEALYKKIIEGRLVIPTYVSDYGADLLKAVLTKDPAKRPNLAQIREHPWFTLTNIKLNDGLIIGLNVIPIDENIVQKMKEYQFNSDEVRKAVISNRHNNITTTYYLLLKLYIKNGATSIADLIYL